METFIPSKDLGILESICLAAFEPALSKRDRQQAFRRAVRVLRDTRLVPQLAEITALGYGISAKGEFGLLISTTQQRVSAQGPLQQPTAGRTGEPELTQEEIVALRKLGAGHVD